MTVLAFPMPPTRCTCGCKRTNHPGGGRCRLCRCGEFTAPVDSGRPPLAAPIPDKRAARTDRDQEMARLAHLGMTHDQIGLEFGIGGRSVRRALKRAAA